jgi:hypothetical protein
MQHKCHADIGTCLFPPVAALQGFAVAFAAFTDFGPVMAFAIAMHNIPEVRG